MRTAPLDNDNDKPAREATVCDAVLGEVRETMCCLEALCRVMMTGRGTLTDTNQEKAALQMCAAVKKLLALKRMVQVQRHRLQPQHGRIQPQRKTASIVILGLLWRPARQMLFRRRGGHQELQYTSISRKCDTEHLQMGCRAWSGPERARRQCHGPGASYRRMSPADETISRHACLLCFHVTLFA